MRFIFIFLTLLSIEAQASECMSKNYDQYIVTQVITTQSKQDCLEDQWLAKSIHELRSQKSIAINEIDNYGMIVTENLLNEVEVTEEDVCRRVEYSHEYFDGSSEGKKFLEEKVALYKETMSHAELCETLLIK